jgi:hypothetical protein
MDENKPNEEADLCNNNEKSFKFTEKDFKYLGEKDILGESTFGEVRKLECIHEDLKKKHPYVAVKFIKYSKYLENFKNEVFYILFSRKNY